VNKLVVFRGYADDGIKDPSRSDQEHRLTCGLSDCLARNSHQGDKDGEKSGFCRHLRDNFVLKTESTLKSRIVVIIECNCCISPPARRRRSQSLASCKPKAQHLVTVLHQILAQEQLCSKSRPDSRVFGA